MVEFGINKALLKSQIVLKYGTLSNYAKAYGISMNGLHNQLEGITDVNTKVISKHATLLGLENDRKLLMEIFLYKRVEKM